MKRLLIIIFLIIHSINAASEKSHKVPDEQWEEYYSKQLYYNVRAISWSPYYKDMRLCWVSFTIDGNVIFGVLNAATEKIVCHTELKGIDFSKQLFVRWFEGNKLPEIISGGKACEPKFKVVIVQSTNKNEENPYQVKVTRVDNGKDVCVIKVSYEIGTTELSSDGTRIAIAEKYVGNVQIWDTMLSKNISEFSVVDKILAMRFSDDASMLAIGDDSGDFHIWAKVLKK